MPMRRPTLWKQAKTAVRRALGPTLSRPLERLHEGLSIRRNRLARNIRELGESNPRFPRATAYRVSDRQVWFGYYDVTPFDRGGRRLLAMAGPRIARTPRRGERIEVGLFKLDRPTEFRRLGETETWCWQQGCRLRWIGAGDRELVLYNRLVRGSPGAVVQDPESGEVVKRFLTPLYDVDGTASHGLTLNFSRLQRLRPGYGYVAEDDPTADDPAPDGDGVWLIDLASGERTLLVSLRGLAMGMHRPTQEGVEHYVNHLSFNPSGDRFVFFHIPTKDGARRPRLMTMPRDGGDARVLEEKIRVSHFTWRDDRTLIVTAHPSDRECEYRTYDVLTGAKSRFGEGSLDRDGHPSVAPDGGMILTDTYPDECGDQELLLYRQPDWRMCLGRYFAPARFRGEWRCDLHPRFSPDGRRVAFDATPDGWRALYVMTIPRDLTERLTGTR